MTSKPDTPESTPARLAPPPVPRRDFLGLAALWSAGSALLFAMIGMIRLPKAAVLPSPSKKFEVALPESLPPGEAFQPPGRHISLFRDGEGVYAISTVCTHLGCIVKPSETGFDCPCHGSKFDPNGAVIHGPAPKALPWLAVKVIGENRVVVDEGMEVPAGTKEVA